MSTEPRITRLERELFHFSKGQTIGLAVVIVLALALAGILAGTLMKRPAVDLAPPPSTGGDSMVGAANTRLPAFTAARAATPTNSGTMVQALNATDAKAVGDALGQVLTPSPVPGAPGGTAPTSPATPGGAATSAPAPQTSPGAPASPSAPSPAPSPGTTGTTGAGVSLSGVVTIPTPPPWTVQGSDDDEAVMSDGRNNFVYALLGQTDPASDPNALLQNLFVEVVMSQEQMSQLQVAQEAVPIQPFGSIVAAALLPYKGLWSDAQGSFELMGGMFVAIRQDGVVLVMTAETTPPEDWAPSEAQEWGPVVNGAYRSFAGVQ